MSNFQHFVRVAALLAGVCTAARAPGADGWLQGSFSPIEAGGAEETSTPVPPGLAVSFCNAHVAEGGKTRMWVRAITADVRDANLEATIVDAGGSIVRRVDLPVLRKGAGEGWFTLDAAGCRPGRYWMRVSAKAPVVVAPAQATFWVERVETPQLACVPIIVDEPVRRDWRSFPVSVGVPMPRSTLDSDHRVRLVDHLGEEVPCQVAATSYWNPDKRDIQWLLVSFLADSAKDAGNRYRLEFGRDVRRAAPPVPLRVTETTSEVSIDTGAIGLVVDRRKATIFKEVRLGDRRVVAGDGAGAFLQDQNRKVFRSAWDRQAPEVTIEERGPIWASIRQQGWYAAKDGQRLCRYDIRIHAFAGQPCVRILHTWVLTHDSRKVQFGDISLRIPLAEAVTGCAFGADDRFQRRALEETLAHDRVSLVQEDSDRFAVHAWKAGVESLLSTGRRAGGWAAVRTKGASVLAHLRYLWQQYPAELEVTPGALAVHFWPEHGFSFTFRERPESYGVHRWPYSDGPLMDLQPRPYVENVLMKDVEKIKGYDQINALGMSKTQEVWLDFAAPERDAAAAQEQALRYEQPIAARAGAEWIAGSLALRPLAVKDEKRFPAVERAIRARWDGETYLQDRCHDYGWLHFGDRHSQSIPIGPGAKFPSVHRYWLVTDYRCGMEPWLLWVRAGERIYCRWAEIISRHLMDVDVIHWTSADVGPPRKIGQFYPMSFAHYCSAPTSMSLHNDPVAFNLMCYYLTGYRRAMDVLRSAGQRELDNDLSRGELHRGHLITGHNQLDLYRVTWDERFWTNAWKAINKAMDTIGAKRYLDWTYTNEFLQDVEDFTGDSRLKAAVLNIADNLLSRPVGSRNSYPAVFIFAHAYRVSGDPRYIAYGKGRLEPDILNINVSDVPERRGRVTDGDNVHFTRLVRQIPGFLYYQQQAESQHGPIERRTPPILFLYERGPVYFLEERDRDFTIGVQLIPMPNAKPFRGELQVVAPDGRVVVKQEVTPQILAESQNMIPLGVPADRRTGVYRLDIGIPTESDALRCSWSVQSPHLGKLVIGLSKFNFWGGEVFFYVPKGAASFKVRVEPRRFGAAYGQPVLLAPSGREAMRLDGMAPAWVEVKPKPEETGGLWGVALHHVGTVEFQGLPPLVCSDPAEFFLCGGEQQHGGR